MDAAESVELPAEGRWTIPPHRTGNLASRTDGRVAGELTVGARQTALRLCVDNVAGTTTIDSRLESADDAGHWTFHGTASRDGLEVPVEMAVTYHGVFRRNGRTSAWLSVELPAAGLHRHHDAVVVEIGARGPDPLSAA
ncbi:MAG: hypothetical protein ABW122_00060 [Ilumatobacteraceae bacterium]